MLKQWIRSLSFSKRCYYCRSKTPYMRPYFTKQGEKVFVCEKCLEYAERRAMQRAD